MFPNNKISSKKRSPIIIKPLHVPGQSLEQARQDLMSDKLALWGTLWSAAIFVAGFEWWQWWFNQPPHPVIVTLIALVIILWTIKDFYKTIPQLRNMWLGIEGERTVGHALEALRAKGFKIIHDFCEDGFNIDHILIGPSGIYLVETKTMRRNGDHKLTYDGTIIRYKQTGCPLPDNPLPQALASSATLCKILRTETGDNVFVKPVVLFPGWFIERTCNQEEVWVLNENSLPSFLDQEDKRLSENQITMFYEKLSGCIRKYDQAHQ